MRLKEAPSKYIMFSLTNCKFYECLIWKRHIKVNEFISFFDKYLRFVCIF